MLDAVAFACWWDYGKSVFIYWHSFPYGSLSVVQLHNCNSMGKKCLEEQNVEFLFCILEQYWGLYVLDWLIFFALNCKNPFEFNQLLISIWQCICIWWLAQGLLKIQIKLINKHLIPRRLFFWRLFFFFGPVIVINILKTAVFKWNIILIFI